MTLSAYEPPVKKCSSCNADIVWVRTLKGKRMPLDAEPVAIGQHLDGPDTERLFALRESMHPKGPLGILLWPSAALPQEPLRVAHWATCPSAAQHRGRNG